MYKIVSKTCSYGALNPALGTSLDTGALATLAGAGLINPSDELENALKRALKLPVEESVSGLSPLNQ